MKQSSTEMPAHGHLSLRQLLVSLLVVSRVQTVTVYNAHFLKVHLK